jgi:hypothetical protein
VLFRLSNLVLEHDNLPPLWRELAAALVSPATGFNRLAFGDRFRNIFPGHDPIYYSRLQIGFSGTAYNGSGTSTTSLRRNEALVDYAIDYGLPGKPGYTYNRPFDYFSFQGTASTANGFENSLSARLSERITHLAIVIVASGDSTAATITSPRRLSCIEHGGVVGHDQAVDGIGFLRAARYGLGGRGVCGGGNDP